MANKFYLLNNEDGTVSLVALSGPIPSANSYVTVEDADDYISNRYRSTSKARIRWGSLSNEDKEILLVNACAEIESLPFPGRKVDPKQPLAFPRLPYQYGTSDEGAPYNIRSAQIELALWLSDDAVQSKIEKRQELQSQGVESFSIGDLSESYGDGGIPLPLICTKCAGFLRPYLSGGFLIC